jgi:hypothetical protein
MSAALRYPHEDILGLARASTCQEMEHADQLGRFVLGGFVSKVGELRSISSPQVYQWGVREMFTTFIGHRTGAELADKGTFSDVMARIGYLAPRTVVVSPGSDTAETLAGIAALDETDPKRFLKPLCGSRAKGTMQAEDPDQALAFARQERRPYLVQTVENTDHEWRYALHRDGSQVRDNAPHGWRMALRKIRPSVVGDGVTSLQGLVEANEAMPWFSRAKYRLHRGRDTGRVPEAGEHVELAVGGNIGARLPDQTEQTNLDRFIRVVADELEAEVGAPLATICFDVGAKNPGTLEGPYDHERLRQELVFYEFQVPFGFFSYLAALPKSERTGIRKVSSSLGRPALQAAVMSTFMNSMLVSGKIASKLS